MADFPTFFSRGVHNTLLFKNGGQFLYKGPWQSVFQNTEIDRWYVGDFASATYNITVEVDSNKKETLQVLVIARPDYANYTVYGRVSIDDEIVDVSATVNDSFLSFKLSAKIPEYEGAKVIYSVAYSGSINTLTPPEPLTFLINTNQPVPGEPSGGGSVPGPGDISLTSLSSSLIPSQDSEYSLGSSTLRWKDLYLSGNTIYIGDTLISASGNTLNLPEGTQIDSETVRSFSRISIPGQTDIDSTSLNDTLNIVAGTGISIITDPQTGTITITNTGSGSSGAATTTTASGPSFGSIVVPGQESVVADRSNDVLNLVAGANISIITDPVSDSITISATGAGGGLTATSIIVSEVAANEYPIVMSEGTSNIAGQSLYANSSITIDVDSSTLNATAVQARWADLAERYLADAEYPPGTVLMFGGEKEVTISLGYQNKKIAGVVSTNPAFVMNKELKDKNSVALALQGRVPCRVIGKINKGDMLVSSSVSGVATASENPVLGSVIGKALENYDSDDIGMIEAVVGRL